MADGLKHLSLSGNIVPCDATVKECPREFHASTPEEMERLVEIQEVYNSCKFTDLEELSNRKLDTEELEQILTEQANAQVLDLYRKLTEAYDKEYSPDDEFDARDGFVMYEIMDMESSGIFEIVEEESIRDGFLEAGVDYVDIDNIANAKIFDYPTYTITHIALDKDENVVQGRSDVSGRLLNKDQLFPPSRIEYWSHVDTLGDSTVATSMMDMAGFQEEFLESYAKNPLEPNESRARKSMEKLGERIQKDVDKCFEDSAKVFMDRYKPSDFDSEEAMFKRFHEYNAIPLNRAVGPLSFDEQEEENYVVNRSALTGEPYFGIVMEDNKRIKTWFTDPWREEQNIVNTTLRNKAHETLEAWFANK